MLAVYWIMFGIVHSVFATERLKASFKNLMGNQFKYYRLCYSIVAAIMVAYILYLNFTIRAVELWNAAIIEKLSAIIAGAAGLVIMCVCIRKYFIDLSGINVFIKTKTKDKLQTDGLNKYVRHPLYSSTLLFAWSFFFFQPVLSNLISCSVITIYTVTGTYFEERKLVKTFGEDYKKYASRVPMLIPRLI